MIGIAVVTHCQLGQALIEAAEFILGEKPENVVPVSVNIREDADSIRKTIAETLKKLDSGEGLLILTDMFGGSPSNLSYSFLEEGRIEVISGVNLPLLIRAISLRKRVPIHEIGIQLEAHGKRSITLASGLLKGTPRSAQKG